MNRRVSIIGFWSGVSAFTAALAYVVVQLLQMYGVLEYPVDEKLIYGTSLCIVVPFMLEMLALHYSVPVEKKFWSHAALAFTIMYAVFVTANYVVQLATVIPMSLKGKLDEVRILQQTPHSLFWDFDAIGYIFMGLATFVAIPVFERRGFQKWVRISFIANALVTPLNYDCVFLSHFFLQIAASWFSLGNHRAAVDVIAGPDVSNQSKKSINDLIYCSFQPSTMSS